MKLNFPIEVPDTDIDRLVVALGCNRKTLEARLSGHAQAALSEYVDMYVGRRAFTRGSDMLELRLALLIRHAFDNTLPTEVEVSRLFQTPLSGSRSLIRAVLAKYRYDLESAAVATVKVLLEAAVWNKENNAFLVQIHGSNLIAVMNEKLAVDGGREYRVERLPSSAATFKIAPKSYDILCTAFKAQSVKKS